MIEQLRLRNFKVLREVDVPLRPLTLVVGPNASGKSSLLEALDALACLVSERKDRLLQAVQATFAGRLAPETLRSRLSTAPLSLGQTATYSEEELDFNLSFQPSPVVNGFWAGQRIDLRTSGFLGIGIRPVTLSLSAKKLAAPSYSKEIVPSLSKDGEGLSTVLAYLQLERNDLFRSLVETLKAIVPTVRQLRLRRSPVEQEDLVETIRNRKTFETRSYVGYELRFDMEGAEDLPAWLVSEGTLLTLGLLTALTTVPAPPELVLLDDLERGLHPRALRELIQQLRGLQKQMPELQIVATSHSPYLLDFLEPEEILLTSLADDGYATVGRLVDHPEFERWKDVMAPGEFWSTVGEAWITEQKAGSAR